MKIFFIIFFSFVIIERLWETFFSNKSKEKGVISGEWTLWALTFVYILVISLTLIEFLFVRRASNYIISLIGFLLFWVAFLGRNYSIRALGKFHSINIEIKKDHRIIRTGLYKYLRHPYYLSIILEVTAIPIIFNCYYTFCFSLLAYVPLVFVRVYLEESAMSEKIGEMFIEYKSEVNAFIPIKKAVKRK